MAAESEDPVARDREPDTTRPVARLATEGSAIGPYRLIRKLGEGGMGVVFQAQQTTPIRRDVALKVIRPGMDSEQVIARFAGERQALALMDHANIARVLDAGTTDGGLPYFVMELVDGTPITRYCDDRRLSVRARIELFLLACHAVQHAHQKGIIHRDLKPSNILVRDDDGRAVLKVIDFGLAKALGPQHSDTASITGLGMLVGTVRYMSPEQADLTRRDVDTRSDIYSLGVLLYELLTGTTPLAQHPEPGESLLETLRRIREEDVVAPSARLRQSSRLAEVAARRQADAVRLPAQVDRELDWITLKTLEKERADRYETVHQLERDLRRYLDGEAVEAAPPSTAYRVRKLMRKHRLGLATAAGFLLLALVSAVGGVWLAVRAQRAERQARAVSDFLRNDVLAQASADAQATPSTSPDQGLTVRVALDRAAARIGTRLAGEPLVEAAVRHTIGEAYNDLGVYDKAQEHLEHARALRRRLLGDLAADTQASTLALALVLERRGRYDDSVALLTSFADELKGQRGLDDPDTVNATSHLGRLLWQQGKYAEAQPLLETALAGQRRTLGPDHRTTLATMNNLALTYYSQGKYAEAEPLLREVLATRQRTLGTEHPTTVTSMSNLAGIQRVRGRHDEAEALYLEARDIRARVLGPDHPDTMAASYNLAAIYQARGRSADAEPLYRQVLDARRRLLGEDHPRTLATAQALAGLMHSQGHLEEAEARLSAVLAARRRVLGDAHPETLETGLTLGRVQIDAQRFVQAERTLRAVRHQHELADRHGWEHATATALLGESLVGQRRHADAEPLLLAGYRALEAEQGAIPADERQVLSNARLALHRLYTQWGRPAEASHWQAAAAPATEPSN